MARLDSKLGLSRLELEFSHVGEDGFLLSPAPPSQRDPAQTCRIESQRSQIKNAMQVDLHLGHLRGRSALLFKAISHGTCGGLALVLFFGAQTFELYKLPQSLPGAYAYAFQE